jgi:hypothetical protein
MPTRYGNWSPGDGRADREITGSRGIRVLDLNALERLLEWQS